MADAPTPWEIVVPYEKRTLSDEHRKHLTDSGIALPIIEGRGYHSLTKEMVQGLISLEQYDLQILNAESWLCIPVYRPDGYSPCEVIRVFGSTRKQKYLWPRGQTNVLDVHPDMLEKIRDRDIPVGFTEGIKKTDALLSAAIAEGIDLIPISVNGCWGWMGDAKGGKRVAIQDFMDIPLNERRTFVISDSDYQSNDNVRNGWTGAAKYLESKTGDHRTFLIVVPPRGLDKQGADDYLAGGGKLGDLLGLAQSVAFASDNQPIQRAPLVLKSGLRLIEEAGTQIPHLITPIMPERSIMLMTGHSGTLKTWHALSMSLDLGFGMQWLEHPDLAVAEPISSIYVNKEMSGYILGQRLKTLARAEKYKDIENARELIEQRLAFVDEAEFDLRSANHRDRLEEAIMEHGARVVFLDSLSMCWTGDENSASEVGQFYSQMRGITERCGNAWCIIHHMLKPQNQSRKLPIQFAIRGSGQLYQQADAAIVLAMFDPDGPHANGVKEVSINHAKARTSTEMPAWLTRFDVNDGQFTTLNYTGKVSEAKARAYVDTGDTSKLAVWMWEAIQNIPLMDSTGTGMRTSNLISLIQSNWPVDSKNAPSESSLRRQLVKMVTDGELEVLDENQRLGNLYRIKGDPYDGS